MPCLHPALRRRPKAMARRRPTRVAPVIASSRVTARRARSSRPRRYRCRYCSHVYDEALGDPDSGIAPGTRFGGLSFGYGQETRARFRAEFDVILIDGRDRVEERVERHLRVHGHAPVPGQPDHSGLLARVASRRPALQMPPLGTQLVDDEAVALETLQAIEREPDDARRGHARAIDHDAHGRRARLRNAVVDRGRRRWRGRPARAHPPNVAVGAPCAAGLCIMTDEEIEVEGS